MINKTTMKTLITTLTAVALLSLGTQKASAGDREWATAGKILTGLVIGGAVAKALEPAPVYHAPAVVYTQPQVVYTAPPPPPVVATVPAPAPVYVQPAPARVYVQPAPVVVYSPPPVYYVRPAPIYPYGYYAPRPVVSFRLGFGIGGGHHHHHPHHRWHR